MAHTWHATWPSSHHCHLALPADTPLKLRLALLLFVARACSAIPRHAGSLERRARRIWAFPLAAASMVLFGVVVAAFTASGRWVVLCVCNRGSEFLVNRWVAADVLLCALVLVTTVGRPSLTHSGT